MTEPVSASGERRSDLPVYLLLAAAAFGVIAASILTQHHFVGGDLIGCPKNATFDCDAVNRSAWSEIRGIPLSVLGFVTYLVVFAMGFTRLTKGPERGAGSMAYAFLIGLFSTSFSVYLFYVSKFVLGKLCLWCMSTYGVNALVLVFSGWALGGPSKLMPAVRADWESLGPKKVLAYPLLGLILIAFGFALFKPGTVFNGPDEVSRFGGIGRGGTADVRALTLSAPYRDPGPGSGFAKGAQQPVLTIVEFADLECPACRRVFWPLSEFVKRHPSEVRLVFRHYPLDRKCNPSMTRVFHEYACDAAMAAEAAGQQGRFWEYVEDVYRLHDEQGAFIQHPDLKRPSLVERARKLGLNVEQFEDALDDDLLLDKILGDLRDGDAFGVDSTPSLYVNGRLVKGAPMNERTFETWLEMAKAGELNPPKQSALGP